MESIYFPDTEDILKVTIGLPVYNTRPFLADAIRSIFAQTFQDWELIIIDDGSTDRSIEIAKSIKDSRVAVYRDRVNRGLAYRLNQIAQLSRGNYIARMDADDLMHPERIAKQVRLLDEHQHIDVVDTGLYSMNIDAIPTGVRGKEPLQTSLIAALNHALLNHATILGRTQWFRQNPYDPLYTRSEDRELWCRTVNHSTFSRIEEPLYFYREIVSMRHYLQSCRDIRKLIRKYGPKVLGSGAMMGHMTMSHFKSMVYRLFAMLHMQKYLVSLRNSRLDPTEAAIAAEVIQCIQHTPVPGLNSKELTFIYSHQQVA
jgi:glycosyltransferase involved in cell wall biosynthesis